MLFYAILFVSFFLVALIIRLYRSVFHDLAQNSLALVNALLSGHEEDVKIKQVEKNTNRLLFSLLKMLLTLLVAFAIGSIPVVIYVVITKADFSSLDFSSFYSILFISLGATAPFVIPAKKKKETGYSELSQLLHHLALDNYNISKKLFRKETKKIIRRKGLEKRKDFVIISGLARAGTTSLMNDLSRIDDFVSLSYANMPFLMCPNLWAKFYKPKTNHLKERSHKDGIMIGLNSNEALEEYFFKVKADDSYIQETHLLEYNIKEEDYSDYLDYQNIVKLDNKKIYLAKNNNFILRYKSMRAFNEDFLMVILYRDPLTHAASLLEKQRYYSSLQKEDAFVLEYMNWLAHHEFGLNQKPFVFSDSKDFLNTDKNSINFWLESWINYYRYVLTLQHPNTILINYNAYCENPEEVIRTIVKKTGIQTSIPDYQAFKNKRKTDAKASKELLEEAQEIFGKLTNKSNLSALAP
ncbi:MAG: sulfotransferase [Bacteroidales bacterium]|nr:sulfotransferase [Bacteroidales bacterium]MCF8388149.1 sulfotransferase [Bacteroidales bacterium]MCF8398244.1 sulfotransferase [Bacteroidales bacterium]